MFGVNSLSLRVDGYETLVATFDDPYLPMRALWGVQRQAAVERFTITPEAFAASDPEPSIGSLLFKPTDPRFPRQEQVRRIDIPATGERLSYSLWLQDEPAPLLFVIPGIGSHRSASNPMALAELAHARGYSVAIVSSPFHPEFVEAGLSSDVPGFPAGDAEDLYSAMVGIRDDLERWRPGSVTSESLMGYSLGGIATLFIAHAQRERPADALRFERFVAINPPVDLVHSARSFDAFFEAPRRWPVEERQRRIQELAMRAFVMVRDGLPEGKPPPFDRTESEFMIGLAGRVIVLETVAAIRRRTGGTLTLAPDAPGEGVELPGVMGLEQFNRASFERFMEDLALPHHGPRMPGSASREELLEQATLRHIVDTLRDDPNVRIVTNADDFINSEEHVRWLEEVVGERLVLFPGGGHLGNLTVPAVQEAIFDALGPAAVPASPVAQTPEGPSGGEAQGQVAHAGDHRRQQAAGLAAELRRAVAGAAAPRTSPSPPDGEVGPRADVLAEAELDVAVRVARHDELLRVRSEDLLVAIGGAVQHHQHLAGANRLTADLHIGDGHAAHVRDGTAPAQHLLDRARDQPGRIQQQL